MGSDKKSFLTEKNRKNDVFFFNFSPSHDWFGKKLIRSPKTPIFSIEPELSSKTLSFINQALNEIHLTNLKYN